MKMLHSIEDGNIVFYHRGASKNYQVRIKSPEGDWVKLSCKTSDLPEAIEFAKEQYYSMKLRKKNNEPAITKSFKYVANIAIKEMQEELASGYGKKIFAKYISTIKNYLIPFFNSTDIDRIDYKKLKEFEEFKKKQLNRPITKSTVTTYNASMNKVFKVAIAHGWLLPIQVPILKNYGKNGKRRPHFELYEYTQLYRHMRTWVKIPSKNKLTCQRKLLMRDLVLILANTGMRLGEAMSLKWKNIDHFHNQNGKDYLRFFVDGKTGKRELLPKSTTARYLKRIASRHDDLKTLSFDALTKIDQYVFLLPNKTILKDVQHLFEDLLISCELLYDRHNEKRSLYSLRHTYATNMLRNNISVHILAKQMGTSVAMIEKHYSHLIPSQNAELLVGIHGSKYDQS